MIKILTRLWHGNHWCLIAARVGLTVYLGLIGALMLFEEKLIYYPSKFPQGHWDIARTPPVRGRISPVIEECWFETDDGVKINGWFCQATQWQDDHFAPIPELPTLLFCHGNAGNITSRYDHIEFLIPIPVNIFIFDYRGYGKSEGTVSEFGLYRDTRSAWDYLLNQKQLPADRIILFGESLGGAMAIELATQVTPLGLILQSTFTSVPDMGKVLYPFIPTWVIRTKMDSLNKIPRLTCPKLIIHGDADEVVPFKLGQQLFAAAAPPKEFYEIPHSGHNETWLVGGQEYLNRIKNFINSCQNH